MKHGHRPNILKNASMQYAPENELGVVFLFADVAKRLQLDIEEIRPKFPDCIAYKHTGDSRKRVRIEFEFNSSRFRSQGHNSKECDCIVCWNHDWPDVPDSLEVIELKRYFVPAKVWIQPVKKDQWNYIDGNDILDGGLYGLSKQTTPGDLVLIYRCYPDKKLSDIFVLTGELIKEEAGWRDGECVGGQIKRLCTLASPIFLDELRNHKILKNSSFIRSNMRGNQLVSEYWHYLYEMIIARNPKVKKILSNYAPEQL
jgi:hypothetical protein